jgi:hypothetical protein
MVAGGRGAAVVGGVAAVVGVVTVVGRGDGALVGGDVVVDEGAEWATAVFTRWKAMLL